MAIQLNSWLLKNNSRNYPFRDVANPVEHDGIVDCHVAVPESLGEGVVYFSKLVITPGAARLELSQDGAGLIATLDVSAPVPYRSYAMTGVSGVHASVVFGEAVQNTTRAINRTLDRDSGALLETVLDRYPGLPGGQVTVGQTSLSGQVELSGGGSVLVEAQDVTYDLPGDVGVKKSVVIRLNPDSRTMTSMLSRCQLPTESGLVPEVVTSINGITPNSNGEIFLELQPHYFVASDQDAADRPGDMLLENGINYDLARPRLKLGYTDANTIAVMDLDDYRNYCGAVGKRDYTITYREKTCSSCISTAQDVPAGGFDAADGIPLVFSGAYIRGTQLVISWVAQALGTAAPGPSATGITITLYDKAGAEYVPTIAPSNTPWPVRITAVASITGEGKRLGADLVPCSTTPDAQPLPTGSSYGVPIVTSVYTLNQVVPKGQRFKLELDYGLIKLAAPATLGPAFDQLSMPYTSCILYAQDPEYDPPTLEEVLPT